MFKKQNLQFHTIYRPEPEGGYTVIVPALPCCITYGKDLKQAKQMIADAIQGYLISLKKLPHPIPTDTDSFISLVEIPIRQFVEGCKSYA